MVKLLTYTFLSLSVFWLTFEVADGACTWPADFASSTWLDSYKGELVFLDTTMTGWSFTVGELTLNEWECYTTEYLDSHGYLIMKTKDNFTQYVTQTFDGYRCLELTKITDVSYRYYEISPVNTANIQYLRLKVQDLTVTGPSGVSELCLTEHGATGSEYKLMIKKGSEEQAKVRCPYSIVGNIDYTHTSVSGQTTCTGSDILDMCTNNKEMRFSYDTCSTMVAYSASDTVWCVDSVPVDGNNFVMVYNGLDDTTDDNNTYRFSCFGISADGSMASVTPQNCKKNQTPDVVPTDNAGTQIGATITMPSIAVSDLCPPCPVLSGPAKGEVSIATNGAATMATYTCLNNYTIAGDTIRICQENNTWSGNTPSCTCVTPESPTNGAVTLSADGSLATYTCIANFTLVGDDTRACQTDTNTWTGSDPTCTPCETLDGLENGNVTVSITDAGTVSVAVYTCDAGATLNGITSRRCRTNGKWTDIKPTCTVCPALITALSGTITLSSDGATTTATVTCAEGYTMIGAQEYTCLTTGSWNAAEPLCVCDTPSSPANGSVTVQNDNTTAIYTCDSGFTLDGPSQRTCQPDGTAWSGTDPTCVFCQRLIPTEGLHIDITTNGTLSSAVFTCDIKHTLSGYPVINCQANGSWEYDTPICEKCTELTSPGNGSLNFFTNGTTTTAQITCKTGTSIQGEHVVGCNSDGSWTSHSVSCVSCDHLDGLQSGSYTMSSNGTTSEVTYSCADGYTLTGSSQAICLDNGTWSFDIKPYCSQDRETAAVVTENDSSLLPVVIALAVLVIILIAVSSIAIYCYCKVKKTRDSGETKHYTIRDDDMPKSIPIAAVHPSAAPMDHQKPLFDGGRATALSFAPESHRQGSGRSLLSANSRMTSASVSRLNLEMIRETTTSSVYNDGVPAPWSKSRESIASGSTDLPRMGSPTMSSLYSSFSSPRRGYTQTPKYIDDSEDTARETPLTDDNAPSSPRKSPKKKRKALRKLAHADMDGTDAVPAYMRDTKSSANKVSAEMNVNKQSFRMSIAALGNELSGSNKPKSKLASPRV